MRTLIGLDIGTSAVKGVLVSEEGQVLAQAARRTEFLRPAPGFQEIDPEVHYRTVCALIGELTAAADRAAVAADRTVAAADRTVAAAGGSGRESGPVAAIGMAAASGNTLLLDDAGRPLMPIISWLDRRVEGRSRELLPGFDFAAVHAVSGWPFSELFPLAHLAWLRVERPELWAGAAHFGMNTDYLLYRLTGRWGMDPSTATTFYLYNQTERRWHQPYLDRLGVDPSHLSALAPSGSILGGLTPEAAADTGLPPGTRVALGAFDHPCAARGTGTLTPGDLLLSCGTSWVGFYPVAERDPALAQGLLIDPFLSPAGPWGAMFALTANGVTIDWHVDHLVAPGEDGDRYELFNRAAASAPRGAGGLFINTSRGVETAGERAAGWAGRYDRAQVARAVMEGTAFEMRRKIEELEAAGLAARRIAMVGGPSESPVWPAILADVTGLELKLINGRTAGAIGAALLAGVGAGLFRDEAEAFAVMGGRPKILLPSESGVRAYQSLYQEYRGRQL